MHLTNQPVQHDLVCLPSQTHSMQILQDTDCLQVPISMISYPVNSEPTLVMSEIVIKDILDIKHMINHCSNTSMQGAI